MGSSQIKSRLSHLGTNKNHGHVSHLSSICLWCSSIIQTICFMVGSKRKVFRQPSHPKNLVWFRLGKYLTRIWLLLVRIKDQLGSSYLQTQHHRQYPL